jgi:hypothetical protein
VSCRLSPPRCRAGGAQHAKEPSPRASAGRSEQPVHQPGWRAPGVSEKLTGPAALARLSRRGQLVVGPRRGQRPGPARRAAQHSTNGGAPRDRAEDVAPPEGERGREARHASGEVDPLERHGDRAMTSLRPTQAVSSRMTTSTCGRAFPSHFHESRRGLEMTSTAAVERRRIPHGPDRLRRAFAGAPGPTARAGRT